MREYILEIARTLILDGLDGDFDEIAAVAGVKSSHVRAYFPTVDELSSAVADDPAGVPAHV